MAKDEPVVIVGAGIGGLAAAVHLASAGVPVMVIERGPAPGGKMRETRPLARPVDSGPTVFTMRWVFDDLFAAAGLSLEESLGLSRAHVLARHAWDNGTPLDLLADADASADAIGAFAGAGAAHGFRAFLTEARATFETLRAPFLEAERPGPITLARRIGFHRPGALFGIQPFATLWSALGRHFADPRLRQLFGRYATYTGSSPFAAPATLMLIAWVEQAGVWYVEGGMQRLAEALQALAERNGASFRFGCGVERIDRAHGRISSVTLAGGECITASTIVLNADAAALADGLFGETVAGATRPLKPAERALSAVTWTMEARTSGFPLARHNVFFSSDYAAEFRALMAERSLPARPTVYVCAQDRADTGTSPGNERLLCLVNAPPVGDRVRYTASEIAACETAMTTLLHRCGLTVTPLAHIVTQPADFAALFPATGGSLYGRATHGPWAAFRRPGATTSVPGLYLAGGAAHPGAGVPMAALSGRLAAEQILSDLHSTRRFRPVAIAGGTSTPSRTTTTTP